MLKFLANFKAVRLQQLRRKHWPTWRDLLGGLTKLSLLNSCDSQLHLTFLSLTGWQYHSQTVKVYQEDLLATPVGYTLEVPSTYASLFEVREEFMAILNSDSWEMNIVWTNSINVYHKVVSSGYMCVFPSFICPQTVQLWCSFMLSYIITTMVCSF